MTRLFNQIHKWASPPKNPCRLVSRPIRCVMPDKMTERRPQVTPCIRRITAYRSLHDGTRYPIGLLANDLLWQWSVSGKSTYTHLRK